MSAHHTALHWVPRAALDINTFHGHLTNEKTGTREGQTLGQDGTALRRPEELRAPACSKVPAIDNPARIKEKAWRYFSLSQLGVGAAAGIWVEARGVAKHPTMHGTGPTPKKELFSSKCQGCQG